MPKPKNSKIYFYDVDQDIYDCIVGFQTQSVSKEMSILRGDSVLQLRGVELRDNIVLMQICKVLINGKPYVGEAFIDQMEDLDKDVIYICHGLYDRNKKRMLIQHNTEAMSSPNTTLVKLLLNQCEKNFQSGLSITLVSRKDQVKEIIKNRGILII